MCPTFPCPVVLGENHVPLSHMLESSLPPGNSCWDLAWALVILTTSLASTTFWTWFNLWGLPVDMRQDLGAGQRVTRLWQGVRARLVTQAESLNGAQVSRGGSQIVELSVPRCDWWERMRARRDAAFNHLHMPSVLTLALEQTTFHSHGMTSSSFPVYRPSIKHLPWDWPLSPLRSLSSRPNSFPKKLAWRMLLILARRHCSPFKIHRLVPSMKATEHASFIQKGSRDPEMHRQGYRLKWINT